MYGIAAFYEAEEGEVDVGVELNGDLLSVRADGDGWRAGEGRQAGLLGEVLLGERYSLGGVESDLAGGVVEGGVDP